jgi:hypothetical protein
VGALAAALEAQGWSVFWDRRILLGKNWYEDIGRALDTSRCVVVAWSAAESREVATPLQKGVCVRRLECMHKRDGNDPS